MKTHPAPLLLTALSALCLPSAGSGADASQILTDAVAVWHFSGPGSADGKSPLQLHGEVKLGVELQGAEREASLVRGGDGKAAEISGGWLDAGQGGDGRMNLRGEAMTVLLRLRNPSGKWAGGELFCKHGGHDRLVYNLYINGDDLGFEFGAENQPRLAGHVVTAARMLSPTEWHDVLARYDGKELVLFMDGLSVARKAATGALRQGNTEPVLIGKSAFKGLIDHAALWQRALADDEIVALSGGAEARKTRREAPAKQIEAQIGREGLTLADQLRGARELRQRLGKDSQRPRYHLMPPDGFWNDINGTIYWNRPRARPGHLPLHRRGRGVEPLEATSKEPGHPRNQRAAGGGHLRPVRLEGGRSLLRSRRQQKRNPRLRGRLDQPVPVA